jgi:TonB family protein
MIPSVRACRVGLLITIVATLCSRSVLASDAIALSASNPQAPKISRVDLTAEKVTIEWDATGRVVAISSSASVPAPASASESQAAAANAAASATAQLTSFLEQRMTAAQLSTSVAAGLREPSAAPVTEVESLAQQVFAYKDWYARQQPKPRPGLVRRTSGSQLVVIAGLIVASATPPQAPGAVLGGVVGSLPAAPPSPEEVRKLKAEGKLQEPTIVKRVPPVYPPIAASARISGDVGVQIVIGADGRVKDAKIVNSIPLLDQAALDAVKQWEFTPLILDGKPAATSMRVTVTFTLKEK